MNYSTVLNMKIICRRIVSALLAVACFTARAEDEGEFSRSGKWNIGPMFHYFGSDRAKTSDGDIDLEYGSSFALGIGASYHLWDHFAIGTEFFGGPIDFTGSKGGRETTADGTRLGLNYRFDYNVLKTRFTPVLSAGVGLMLINGDSSLSSGWLADLEWFETPDLSWNFEGGFLWNITDSCFIQATGGPLWADVSGTDSALLFYRGTLKAGFSF